MIAVSKMLTALRTHNSVGWDDMLTSKRWGTMSILLIAILVKIHQNWSNCTKGRNI